MHPFIESKLPEIKRVLAQHDVKAAYLFGSAITERFGENSDVDFLVEYNDKESDPVRRGGNALALQKALHELLQRDIDIVNAKYLKNPYFIEELNETKRAIYAA